MTACASAITVPGGGNGGSTPRGTAPVDSRQQGWALAADGSYAARLAGGEDGRGRYVERWALGGSDAYTVDLRVDRPEAPGSALLALADGRVLIARPGDGSHQLALLYPTGPGTGELPLGALESDRLTLLPPAPDGHTAYVLVPGFETTAIWLVTSGDSAGDPPRPVADVPGHCLDGQWLDRAGRMLALNRRESSGRTTAVAVDLARGGEVTPLLEIGDRSDDRLLFADPDSGLLLVRSDAPGEVRTGWGVLGSHRPVRFPEALHQEELLLEPFAIQPGQELMPEHATVALRAEGPNGTWVALWRPGQRDLRHLAAPPGWLPGAGALSADGELLLPYVQGAVRGVAPVAREVAPEVAPESAAGTGLGTGPGTAVGTRPGLEPGPAELGSWGPAELGPAEAAAGDAAEVVAEPEARATDAPSARTSATTVRGTGAVRAFAPPVPLQQAPLAATKAAAETAQAEKKPRALTTLA